ncbi:MAG: RNA polymerase subunit sigma [Bacteroides sp. 43_108]|nr:MAG: RNA polymerase subunit sigma [Bacteroides sp. 43_108]
MLYSGNDPETTLLEQIRHGDKKAMKELYCHYSGYLNAVCSRYIACDEDVRDVLQESFIKIFSSIDKFCYKGDGSLKAWMSKIAVNESLTLLNKKEKLAIVQYESDIPDTIDDNDDDEGPDTGDIPVRAIQAMIRKLPTGYRTVFNLYVFEGKSHKEIAEMLNLKESSSASQLHRAKALLAKMIQEYKSTNY